MPTTTRISTPAAPQTISTKRAWLHFVVLAPEDQRSIIDDLMSEQGQCWVGGQARTGSQAPLMKYDFSGPVDRIEAMSRAVVSILRALDLKFYSFVVPQ